MDNELNIGIGVKTYHREYFYFHRGAETALPEHEINFIPANGADEFPVKFWLHILDAANPAYDRQGSCYHLTLSADQLGINILTEVWVQLDPRFRDGKWRLAMKLGSGMGFEATHPNDLPHPDCDSALVSAAAFLLSSLPKSYGLDLPPWCQQVASRLAQQGPQEASDHVDDDNFDYSTVFDRGDELADK